MPQRDPSSPQRASTGEPDLPPHATAASLRRGLWNHLLVYPPLVSAICGLARARLDPSRRADAFLVRLLGGPSPCPREPLPARPPPSREQLASALLALDPHDSQHPAHRVEPGELVDRGAQRLVAGAARHDHGTGHQE